MAILGIDEVGRGPIAGPLVLGAVVFPEWEEEPEWYEELRDSKKLSKRKRERLAENIQAVAGVGLGFVMAGEVDRLGITEALKLGTRRAAMEVQKKKMPFSEIIIDGTENFLAGTKLEKYTTTLVKGDDKIKEISAASIVAKVKRDDYMTRLARIYPEYGFENHVGYGTQKHLAAIDDFGLCPEHRRSVKILRRIAEREGEDLSLVFSGKNKKDTTGLGNLGEAKTAEFLEEKGHTIIARNFKTKVFEIDIISTFQEEIYFTEVKYRKNDDFGGGLSAINSKKLKQMKFAAEMFMKLKNVQLDPKLAVAKVSGSNFEVEEWFPLS